MPEVPYRRPTLLVTGRQDSAVGYARASSGCVRPFRRNPALSTAAQTACTGMDDG